MNMRDERDGGDGGGLIRDGATQTGRAVLLIVAAIVVAVVLLHHNKPSTVNASATSRSSSTVAPPSSATTVPPTVTTPTTAPATTTPSTVPVADVKVLVLNATSFTQPYAGEFTSKLKTLGYDMLTPNNATGTVKKSVVYVITHGFVPEGRALATSLGLPASAVKTNVPSGPPLSTAIPGTGANLVLVVGPDIASQGASTSPGTTPTPGTTAPASSPTSPVTTAAAGT